MFNNNSKLCSYLYNAIRSTDAIVEITHDENLYIKSDGLTLEVSLPDFEVLECEIKEDDRVMGFDFFTEDDFAYILDLIDKHLQERIALEVSNRNDRRREEPSQKYGF